MLTAVYLSRNPHRQPGDGVSSPSNSPSAPAEQPALPETTQAVLKVADNHFFTVPDYGIAKTISLKQLPTRPTQKTPARNFFFAGVFDWRIFGKIHYSLTDSTSRTKRVGSLFRNELTTLNTASLKPPMFRMSSRSAAWLVP